VCARTRPDNKQIPSDLRRDALQLAEDAAWKDDGADGVTNHEDDEYRWAGVHDPKIVVTTSRDPSSKLRQFAKVHSLHAHLLKKSYLQELKLLLPNSQRMNRGHYEIKQLVEACRANEVKDFVNSFKFKL
jgi:U3 small nucleolar ribonucleoprotein protein IMP4